MKTKQNFWMVVVLFGGCLGLLRAQQRDDAASARGGRAGRDDPAQTWWVNKTVGGVYPAPMRPIWRLSVLKAMHAGANNWSEQIIKDPEQDATYNSAGPGTKFPRRMHPDTYNVFVVLAGEIQFTIQDQPPVVATRGSIVNILKATIFSYEIAGTQNALWVDVNPNNYKTIYPSDDPPPQALPGAEVIKVTFSPLRPTAYTAPNQVHWNLFKAAADCAQAAQMTHVGYAGTKVLEEHLYANPLYGFADPNDPQNACAGQGRGGAAAAPGAGRGAAPAAAFNPQSTFGHMHAGPAEWWIVQAGHIRAQFENVGEFHAEEGDVLYAAPMMWHQMAFEGPGQSCRLAMGGYQMGQMVKIGSMVPK